MVPPSGAVEGGLLIELTTRLGTSATVMVPAASVQLLLSTASTKVFGPSAHACIL